jgi:hypothetical protein
VVYNISLSLLPVMDIWVVSFLVLLNKATMNTGVQLSVEDAFLSSESDDAIVFL